MRFVKYVLVREEIGTTRTEAGHQPASDVYFELRPSGCGDGPRPGEEVSYAETEGRDAYVRGRVNNSATATALQLVERRVFFTDEYSYWPNGKLKARVMTKADGTVVKSSYDEEGRELPPDNQ